MAAVMTALDPIVCICLSSLIVHNNDNIDNDYSVLFDPFFWRDKPQSYASTSHHTPFSLFSYFLDLVSNNYFMKRLNLAVNVTIEYYLSATIVNQNLSRHK